MPRGLLLENLLLLQKLIRVLLKTKLKLINRWSKDSKVMQCNAFSRYDLLCYRIEQAGWILSPRLFPLKGKKTCIFNPSDFNCSAFPAWSMVAEIKEGGHG